MRCDLHVHTIHSGMCTVPVMRRICRESYNEPEAVYDRAKRQGMDLVTVTDHDSIDAAESLRGRLDFFLSEEVSCVSPFGTRFHMGVYDIGERQHLELQRRRDDAESLLAYLDEQRLLFSINHPFSSLTGPRAVKDFLWFAERFAAVETRNGQMPEECNNYASWWTLQARKVALGGSDSHTLAGIGRTYTEVAHARDKAEFLAGLRRGLGQVRGEAGGYWKLTRAVLEIGGSMMRERPWTRLLAPLALAVPAITAACALRDLVFARSWRRRLDAERSAILEAHADRMPLRRLDVGRSSSRLAGIGPETAAP